MTDEEKTNQEKQHKKYDRRKGKPRAHGTGSVFQRKDRKGKQWVAQIILGNGKTRQTYYKTQKEAEDALNEMLYQYRRGTLITEKDQTVKQHFEYWLDIHKARVRLSTYLQYRRLVNKHILPMLGYRSLQKLSAHDLDALYARKLEEGLTPAYIRDIHVVMHMALKQAVRWRLITYNVSEDVTPPRETQPRQRQILTPEQAQKLLATAKGHRLAAMLTLALTTGMRRGELLALRWQDIDVKHGTLQVQRTVSPLAGSGYVEREPKTAKSRRTIKLPHFVMDVLREHRTHQLEARLEAGNKWQEHDLVFCNRYGGFLSPAVLFLQFTSLLKDAGLPHMRFHDLRHSAATILLSMGVPANVVQELLGHSHISMTLGVYGHVLSSMQQDAMDKLDDLFGKGEDEEHTEQDSGQV